MDITACMQCGNKTCTSKVPIFTNLEPQQLMEVTGLIVRKKFKKGEMVFLDGDKLDGLYIINQGKIKIFKYTKEAKEQILYILSEGDFFGELSLISDEEASYNVEAIEALNMCLIRKNDFSQILKMNPEITLKILEATSQRLLKLETLVQSLGTKDVEARIAQMLIEMTEEFGIEKNNSIELIIPLTREDMANYIGVTRETISRKLSNLQDEGIIKLVGNKKIIINNLKVLKDLL